MKQRMKDFRQWVKEHKGLLAVAGISVTVLVALVLCARNKDEIDHILSLLKKTVKNAPDEDVVGSVSINLSNATQPVLEVYDSETHERMLLPNRFPFLSEGCPIIGTTRLRRQKKQNALVSSWQSMKR